MFKRSVSKRPMIHAGLACTTLLAGLAVGLASAQAHGPAHAAGTAGARQELRAVTVDGLYWKDRAPFPKAVPKDATSDVIISITEWLPDQDYHQLRSFYARAGHAFVLHAPGQPDLPLTLDGWNYNAFFSPQNQVQGFGARLRPEDYARTASGVAYSVKPLNTSAVYRWNVASGVTITKP